MLAVRFPVSRRRFYAGTWLSTSVHVESTPSFLPLRTAAAVFFFLFSSFFPTSAHTLSNLLSANRLSFMTRPSSFSHPVTVYHSWLVLFLLSSHLHHSLPPLTAGATWRSHVTLECVMLEPCVGAARKKTGLELQRHSSVCGWLWKLSTWHGPNGRRHEERDVSRRGNGRWWWVGK